MGLDDRIKLLYAPPEAVAKLHRNPESDTFGVWVQRDGASRKVAVVTSKALALLAQAEQIEIDCSAAFDGVYGKPDAVDAPEEAAFDAQWENFRTGAIIMRRHESVTLDEYQQCAAETAYYPKVPVDSAQTGTYGRVDLPIYPALGLAGETGEFVDMIKKGWRDGVETFDRPRALKELGDILWYVAMCARDLDASLGEIALANLEKLAARKAKGTLGGSGNDR